MTASNAARATPASASSRFIPVIAVVLSIGALYFAREVLVPFALAVLLAFLLSPVVRILEGRLGRAPSVALVLLVTLSSAVGVGWVVTNQLIDVVTQLPAYSQNVQNKMTGLQGRDGSALRKATDSLRQLSQYLSAAPPTSTPKSGNTRVPTATTARPLPVEVVDHPPSAFQSIGNMLGPLAAPLATALIVVVFTIFMLMKREDLRNRLIRLAAHSHLTTITELLDDAARRVSSYLVMQFSINATFGCLIAIGLHFIGVPNALLWGVLAGMLRFLPYVGPLAGGAMPFLLALVVFDGWTRPLITLGFFLLVELVTSNAIEPMLGAARTGISPLAILVAAVFWGALWGPPGLLLSTPLTVCLVVLGRYVPQLEFLYVMLGDEPVLAPEAHFYQRLLALDQQEAQTVVDAYLKDRSLIEVHDAVILPAIRMAEQDRHNGALDEGKAAFIVQSISEIIGLVAEYESEGAPGVADPLPAQSGMRIICLPATDEADEIAAAMLAQVLERAGFPVVCLPVNESPADAIAQIGAIVSQAGDVVCISALPPFALLKARTLSKRLQARFPELRVMVGLWNFTGSESATARFGKAFAHTVVTTLADALAQVRSFAAGVAEHKDVEVDV